MVLFDLRGDRMMQGRESEEQIIFGVHDKPKAQPQKDRKKYRQILFGGAFYVWRFRIVTSLILVILAGGLNRAVNAIVNLDGTVITTANMGQFISWKTPILAIVALLIVFVYIVFDILSQIYLCDDLIQGTKPGVFRELARGFRSLRRFLNPKGILIMVFILFGVPLCGIGFSVGLTKGFYIPRFISSVMFSNRLIQILYWVMIGYFILITFQSVFCFHGILIDHMKPTDALKRSKQLVRANWKNMLLRVLKILLTAAIIVGAVYLLTRWLPRTALLQVGETIPDDATVSESIVAGTLTEQQSTILGYRVISSFVILMGKYMMYLAGSLFAGYFMVQLTRMYYEFTSRDGSLKRIQVSKGRYVQYVLIFLAIPVIICVSSILVGSFYDYIVEAFGNVAVTAHRTGGRLASENSLEGIDASVEHGCYGGETDIQRTKDGYYIILHDNTFKRLTGVNKKPGDMTLEEIKKLRIKDTTGSGELLEVPTLEELLDRGKGRIKLFLELKGVSADRKMADDIVKAVKERDMVDDVILISLKYNVIEYVEKTYPEIETGVLIFAGIGDVSELNCDMVIMEEEMSTDDRIESIHDVDKKVGVWTVNTKTSMYHFLDSEADTVITDEILLAEDVQAELDARTDYEFLEDNLRVPE